MNLVSLTDENIQELGEKVFLGDHRPSVILTDLRRRHYAGN